MVTPAQHRLFAWEAHNPQAASSAGYRVPTATGVHPMVAAAAAEGVRQARNQQLARLLSGGIQRPAVPAYPNMAPNMRNASLRMPTQ